MVGEVVVDGVIDEDVVEVRIGGGVDVGINVAVGFEVDVDVAQRWG